MEDLNFYYANYSRIVRLGFALAPLPLLTVTIKSTMMLLRSAVAPATCTLSLPSYAPDRLM
jgi:hypothetical protein